MSTNDGLQPPKSFPLGTITAEVFLRDYWQKKPCLFRAVWPDIENCLPIDADELAGIAAEESADSRLISGTLEMQDWAVTYGPFNAEDYADKGEADWTLLVQDVEKHYPPLKSWLQCFNFLPSWRLDDIMISFAARGGSVGPHTDQYDVFLFQASGRRRWQISQTYNPELLDDDEIKVLKQFNADETWDLEPGDLLYLPPNIAHHGVALEPCLSYSIGLRAPSKAELFADLGEWFAHQEDQGGRYADADLRAVGNTQTQGMVDATVLTRVQKMLELGKPGQGQSGLDPELADWFCQFICAYRLSGSPTAPETQLSEQSLLTLIHTATPLYRNPWSRFCWRKTDDSAYLYATGMKLACPQTLAELICQPADELAINAEQITLQGEELAVLTSLFNSGQLLLEND